MVHRGRGRIRNAPAPSPTPKTTKGQTKSPAELAKRGVKAGEEEKKTSLSGTQTNLKGIRLPQPLGYPSTKASAPGKLKPSLLDQTPHPAAGYQQVGEI